MELHESFNILIVIPYIQFASEKNFNGCAKTLITAILLGLSAEGPGKKYPLPVFLFQKGVWLYVTSCCYLLGMRLCPHLVPKLLWLPPGRWVLKSPSASWEDLYSQILQDNSKEAAFKQEWKQLPQIIRVKYRENSQTFISQCLLLRGDLNYTLSCCF